MMFETWKQIPWQFKIIWVLGGLVQISLVGLIFWAVYRFVVRYT